MENKQKPDGWVVVFSDGAFEMQDYSSDIMLTDEATAKAIEHNYVGKKARPVKLVFLDEGENGK